MKEFYVDGSVVRAVMEDGKLLEKGPVKEIFANPKCETAKNFIGVYNKFRSDYWEDEN